MNQQPRVECKCQKNPLFTEFSADSTGSVDYDYYAIFLTLLQTEKTEWKPESRAKISSLS